MKIDVFISASALLSAVGLIIMIIAVCRWWTCYRVEKGMKQQMLRNPFNMGSALQLACYANQRPNVELWTVIGLAVSILGLIGIFVYAAGLL